MTNRETLFADRQVAVRNAAIYPYNYDKLETFSQPDLQLGIARGYAEPS